MKRVFSFILALAILCSMIVLPISAAEPVEKTAEELAIMQKAVIETALAYYRKGNNIIYDYATMTILNRRTIGISHMSSGDAPELAAEDNILYTNCSDFACNVYLDAFGYAPGGDERHSHTVYLNYNKSANEPDVVLQFTGGGEAERSAFVQKAMELLEPGDIVTTCREGGADGHTMLYLGDYKGDGQEYTIHSSGSPGTVSLAEELRSKGATIGVTNWGIFLGGNTFGVENSIIAHATILRPLRMIKFEDMTPAAKGRVAYSMLDIDRSTDVFGYTSVEQGQEIEVTVTVRNAGDQDYKGLSVTEILPTGAELVGTPEGAAVSDTGLTWKIDLASKEKTELTYTVKVTAAPGETVSLPAGSVDTIPTRALRYTVCNSLIDPEPLAAIAKDKTLSGITENMQDSELRFANEFYKKVMNFDLGLPETVNELLTGIAEKVQVAGASASGGYMLVPKAADAISEEFKNIYNMILPEHFAGACLYFGISPDSMQPQGRVMTMFRDSYMPGDIFIQVDGESYVDAAPEDVNVYINLGNGKVAASDKNGLRIRNFKDTVPLCLKNNVTIALRPTLVYDDIMPAPEAVEPETPEVPETPAAPETPETPETPEAPAEQGGTPVVLIAGIAAAVVILAVVLVLVLKKKKK